MTIPVYAAGRTESSVPTIRDVGDAVPYEAVFTDIRMDGVRSPRRITDKAPRDECPAGLQLVDKPHPCHSEERSDVGIRIFLDGNMRKTQNLCVLETDCHASVRTGSQ